MMALHRALVTIGGAGLVVTMACGGGEDTVASSTGTGGAGTTTSSSTTATTSSSGSSTSGSSSTGTTGDGNDTFATAEPIDTTAPIDGDLSPTGDVDFYALTGQANQPLFIFTRAQGSELAFDPDTINTVITLYDENQQPIAQNNDRVPLGSRDSELFTILPADGTYYIKVWECFSWASDPAGTCGGDGGTADKTNTAYTLSVFELDPSIAGNIADTEDPNVPAAVTYAPAQSGYYLSVLWGGFTDGTDVDPFTFTPPLDGANNPAGTRTTVTFYVLPAGKDGNGSTSAAGRVWLTDPGAADPAKPIAEIYGPNYTGAGRVQPPLVLGQPYVLNVEHPTTSAGANDFYFLLHGMGWSNPLEQDDIGNDDPAGAELLSPDANQPLSHYLEGDLDLAKLPSPDVDHFKAAVPAGATQVAFACTAQRSGSGLRGFTGEILDGATSLVTTVETAGTDVFSGYVAVPASATELALKLSAQSQDPNVSSSFYRCGFHFRQ